MRRDRILSRRKKKNKKRKNKNDDEERTKKEEFILRTMLHIAKRFIQSYAGDMSSCRGNILDTKIRLTEV